jgi:hypothetical protein
MCDSRATARQESNLASTLGWSVALSIGVAFSLQEFIMPLHVSLNRARITNK